MASTARSNTMNHIVSVAVVGWIVALIWAFSDNSRKPYAPRTTASKEEAKS
jgi:hypothetical protein